jgi:hypothetical protein
MCIAVNRFCLRGENFLVKVRRGALRGRHDARIESIGSRAAAW